MRASFSSTTEYALAIGLPLTVALISWFSFSYISAANIALLFISSVIIVAVQTSTLPALISALLSFVLFNLTATEPRGTLYVLHRQDLIMLVLFLLVALFVGRLAASLKEQFKRLQSRELMTRIEVEFMQAVSAAVSLPDIIEVLRAALARIPGLEYRLIRLQNGQIQWRDKDQFEPPRIRQQVSEHLKAKRAHNSSELDCENFNVFFLGDGAAVHTVLITYASVASAENQARIAAQQTLQAMTRTRLASELESEQQARENESMRSSLLFSLSHDFKTPLTAMIGASSTLLDLDESLQQEQRRELLESILSEAHRLSNFTQKLLDLSQISKGTFSVQRSTVDIRAIIGVAVTRIQKTHQHPLSVTVEPDLPGISIHAALIEQAVYNVLDNACKFTPADKPVALRCFRLIDNLIITVDDSGPGIPDIEKSQVFNLFHSIDRGDRRSAGSGLGLAICKGMVAAHGGHISILDSGKLGGCLVKISLPLNIGD